MKLYLFNSVLQKMVLLKRNVFIDSKDLRNREKKLEYFPGNFSDKNSDTN